MPLWLPDVLLHSPPLLQDISPAPAPTLSYTPVCTSSWIAHISTRTWCPNNNTNSWPHILILLLPPFPYSVSCSAPGLSTHSISLPSRSFPPPPLQRTSQGLCDLHATQPHRQAPGRLSCCTHLIWYSSSSSSLAQCLSAAPRTTHDPQNSKINTYIMGPWGAQSAK